MNAIFDGTRLARKSLTHRSNRLSYVGSGDEHMCRTCVVETLSLVLSASYGSKHFDAYMFSLLVVLHDARGERASCHVCVAADRIVRKAVQRIVHRVRVIRSQLAR